MTTPQTNPDGDTYDGPPVRIGRLPTTADRYEHATDLWGDPMTAEDTNRADFGVDVKPLVRTGQGEYARDLVPFIVGMTYGIIIVSIIWLVCIWST